MGIENFILENDCLVIVSEINKDNESFMDQCVLVHETRTLMKMFQICNVTHVHRIGNEAAHRLVRRAWNVEDIEMWRDGVPSNVSQAVWLDKNFM